MILLLSKEQLKGTFKLQKQQLEEEILMSATNAIHFAQFAQDNK